MRERDALRARDKNLNRFIPFYKFKSFHPFIELISVLQKKGDKKIVTSNMMKIKPCTLIENAQRITSVQRD